MIDDAKNAAIAAWAARNLPGRLDVASTSRLLGFAEHDIPILISWGKLVPLGDPAPNAPKWFCAIEVIQLATDREWLSKATREIGKYWRHRRDKQPKSDFGTRLSNDGVTLTIPPRLAVKPSPKSSPVEQKWSVN